MLASLLVAAVCQKPAITVRLMVEKSTYYAGEAISFKAMARNDTKAPIYLIPQGDGMQSGRKAPLAQLQIKTNGQWEPPPELPGCGNTDPLEERHFAKVEPAGQVDLLGGMMWSGVQMTRALAAPGTYEVRFVYDTRPVYVRWLGGPMGLQKQAEHLRLLRTRLDLVPKGLFVSNSVKVTIVPSP